MKNDGFDLRELLNLVRYYAVGEEARRKKRTAEKKIGNQRVVRNKSGRSFVEKSPRTLQDTTGRITTRHRATRKVV